MPMLDLIVDSFFTDLFAVLLVQPGERAAQARLSLVSLVQVVEVLHVVSFVLLELTLGRGDGH